MKNLGLCLLSDHGSASQSSWQRSSLDSMAKLADNKFAWVIKDFSSLIREKCYSEPVQIGDCKWRLSVYPKGSFNTDHLSVFLEVADRESLPFEWRRYIKFQLAIVQQVSQEPSVVKEAYRWFDREHAQWGFRSIIPFTKIHDKNEGFLVNEELVIVAEVNVLQIVGSWDKSEEKNLSKLKQVEPLSSPQDIAVDFRARTQHLKTACMNVLLSLTQTLCQKPQELSIDDVVEAEKAVTYMKESGLEVEWLEKKLNEVKEKK